MSPMTATTADVDKQILLLTGENCTMWAFWMKARLLKKGLWRVLNTGSTTDEEYDAFDFLVSTCSESILSRLLDAKTANDLWQKLRKLYASTSIVVAIEDEIHRFKYSSGSMEDHFNEFGLLISRHGSAGGDMSAISVALVALRTFSDMPELNQLAKTIRLTCDLAKLTLESIESKFVIEARDLVDRDAACFSAIN